MSYPKILATCTYTKSAAGQQRAAHWRVAYHQKYETATIVVCPFLVPSLKMPPQKHQQTISRKGSTWP